MSKLKSNRDDPKHWKAWDDYAEARSFAALNGVFDLKLDGKVGVAFLNYEDDFIRDSTRKLLKRCGVTKPKFKKPKQVGMPATRIPGTRAYGARLFEEKLFGVPKGTKGKSQAKKKAESQKPKKAVPPKVKAPHKNPENPPNPGLPHVDAYSVARAKEKRDETLLYIIHQGDDIYTAVYGKKNSKKKRKLQIKGNYSIAEPSWVEQNRLYAEKVAEWNKKKRLRKAKPKKAVPKKKVDKARKRK